MKIMIDPGHGGKDPGASGHGLIEKDYTLKLAIAVKNEAESVGVNAVIRLTRTTDRFISLSKRADMANNWGADYFLSLHLNAGGGTGVESYSHIEVPAATDEINKKYYNSFVDRLGRRDRGYKQKNLAVLRETEMSAILVENLFLDHVDDAEFLKSKSGFSKLVAAHVSGLKQIAGTTKAKTPGGAKKVKNIKNGSRGNDVNMLQIGLSAFGFNPGSIDGIFGNNTEQALRGFQKAHGLSVDGIFGPKSFNSMLQKTP